jgi:hypothetical protein
MAADQYNLVDGATAEDGAPLAPVKFIKAREEFADLANDRARLRQAETQQLLCVCGFRGLWC